MTCVCVLFFLFKCCALAIESLSVLRDEKLVENSFAMGELFRNEMRAIGLPMVTNVRGKGLFNAIEIAPKGFFFFSFPNEQERKKTNASALPSLGKKKLQL